MCTQQDIFFWNSTEVRKRLLDILASTNLEFFNSIFRKTMKYYVFTFYCWLLNWCCNHERIKNLIERRVSNDLELDVTEFLKRGAK